MRFRALASVVLLALIAGACGNDQAATPADDSLPSVGPGQSSVTDDVATTTTPDATQVEDTIQGSWTLVGLTIDGESIDMLDDWPVTLTIDGDQIGGTAACNSYGGTVQIDGTSGGRFVVSELFSTEMGCEPVAMEMEQRFLGALQAIDSYELADGLYLGKVGMGTSLEFQRDVPVPDAELTGTTWVLDTLLSGDTASNSPGMGEAFLEFGDDGMITGSTGCRQVAGTWQSDGADIQITSMRAIDDPNAGVCAPTSEALDGQIMSVLGAGLLVAIDGRRLTLTGATGDGLSFRVGETSRQPSEDEQAGSLDPAGGVDGPVMYWQQTGRRDSEAAEVRGTLVLEGDCLYISAEFGRFPVLWPFGTRWQTDPAAAVLPDGTTIEIGQGFSGGGGYHHPEALQSFTSSQDVVELAARCAEGDDREVAVVQGL